MNSVIRCSSIFLGLFVWLLLSLLSCQPSISQQNVFPPLSIIDYIHQPNLKTSFYSADSLKWNQQYLSAANAFERLLEKEASYTLEEKVYLNNQLVRCFLFTRQYEKAGVLLEKVEVWFSAGSLSAGAVADFLLNRSKYLQLIGEGMEVLADLEEAEILYAQVYESGHLKLMETAVEIGIFQEYYASHFNSLELELHYLDKAKHYLNQDSLLLDYAKEYFHLKSISLFAQRKNSEGLISADVAIRLAEANVEFQDTIFITRCLNSKAIHYKSIGEKEQGNLALMEALGLVEKIDKDIYAQETYKNLGLHYAALKDSFHFNLMLNKIEHQFPKANIVHLVRLKARWAFRTKNYKQAIPLYKKLIVKLDQKSIRYNRTRLYDESYFLISRMYEETQELDSSIHYLTKALFLGDERYHKKNYTWNDLKDLHFDNSGNQQFIYTGLLARSYAQRYNTDNQDISSLEKALHLYQKTDFLLFNYSLMSNDEASLNFLSELVANDYPQAINSAYYLYKETNDSEYLEQANFFMERMKSFSLYRDIYTSSPIKTSNAQALSQKEEQIRKELAALKWKRFLEDKAHQSAQLDKAIQQQLDELENLYRSYKRDFPLYFSAKMQIDFQPIKEARNYLSTKTKQEKVIIQYAFDKEVFYVLLLKKDTSIFKKIPIPTHLDSILIAFHKSLSHYEGALDKVAYQNYLNNAFYLYQMLIEPIVSSVPKEAEVLIIPDERIGQIPFEALLQKQPNNRENINYQQLAYLIKDWKIEYATSLKTYLHKIKNKKELHFPPRILAFADSKKRTTNHKTIALRDSQLINLPNSAKELLSIQHFFGAEGNIFFFGKESTRHHFLQHIEKPLDIVHLALHASADKKNWLHSKIYFRQVSKDGKNLNHDPILGYELSNLDIKTSLVILSACQTAQGVRFKGEGTYSLARCFIKSGARTVISSLWSINDQTTSQLIHYFYKQLQEQKDVVTALRSAKLEYLASSDEYLAFPAFWAGVVALN